MSIGTRFIGRYKVLEELGRGGMGIVYRGEDPRLERAVAIKVLPPRKTSGKALERFKREARVCARLDHPYILKIFDYGEEENTYHIVMEYVEGITLRDVIGDEPIVDDIDVPEMARIFAQVCQALEYAHMANITHRDIKPENIMVTTTSGRWEPSTSKVKVMDFGLAVLEGHHSLTDQGAVMGTIAYFAPEQARGEAADQRSDIYSLGVVFYEMLTGELPFDATNPSEMIRRHLETPPPSPRIVNPRVSPALERIALRCMRKSPADRYQSVREIREDLEAYRAEAHIPAHYFWGASGMMPEVPPPRLAPPRVVEPAPQAEPEPELSSPQAASAEKLRQLWMQGKAGAPEPPRKLDIPPLASPYTPGMPPDIASRLGPPKHVPRIGPAADSNAPPPVRGPGELEVKDKAAERAEAPPRHEPARPAPEPAREPPPQQHPPPSHPKMRSPMLPAAGMPPIASSKWMEEASNPDPALNRVEHYLQRLRHDEVGTRGREGDLPPNICTCGMENPAEKKYCGECGSLLAPSRFLQAREAQSHIDLGLRHLRNDNLSEAHYEFSEALQRDPNHADAHKYLGRTLLRMGDSVKAEEELRLASSLNPQDAETLIELAHLLRQTSRKAEAVAALQEAVRLRPQDPAIRCQLAFLHAHRGNMQKAVEEYQQALAWDQRSVEAHLQLGIIFGAQNFVREAIQHFEAVTQLDPENLTAWQWLGKLYGRFNRLGDAEKAFQNAISIAPDDADVHADLGSLYEAQRREDLAVRELRQAIALEQGHGEARHKLAQLYLRHRQPQMAIKELEDLANYHPTDSRVHQQLGELYLDQGNLDRALLHFERTVSLDPSSADMHNRLGEIYRKKDYASLSISEYQKAVSLDPYNPGYHEDLGMAYYVNGSRDMAIQEIKKACILDSRNVDYFKALGMLNVEDGRLEEAIQYLKRALELAPRDPQAHALLGRVYAQQKLINWAVLEFQKALEYDPTNKLMHIYLARSYAELGRPDDAVHEFRKAIALMESQAETPENRRALARSYQDLGKAYLESGNVQAAREMIESAWTMMPADVRGMHLMGLVYAAQKKTTEALEYLSKALEREPHNPDILSDMGQVYQDIGDSERALMALRKAVSLAPRKAVLYERIAGVLGGQGKFDEARDLVRKAMTMDMRRADYYHSVNGKLYMQQGQYQKAAAEYQQARTINGYNWRHALGMARAFESLGRYTDAVNELREVLQTLPLSDSETRELQGELDRIRSLH